MIQQQHSYSSKNNADIIGKDRCSRSVYVGNLPELADDRVIRNLLGKIGPVVSFRRIYDRQSLKPKAYGFCEYEDSLTCEAAMDSTLFCNGKKLEIHSSHSSRKWSQKSTEPAAEKTASVEKTTKTTKTTEEMSLNHVYAQMLMLKRKLQENNEAARRLLLNQPELTLSMLEALLSLRLLKPIDVRHILNRETKTLEEYIVDIPDENIGQFEEQQRNQLMQAKAKGQKLLSRKMKLLQITD